MDIKQRVLEKTYELLSQYGISSVTMDYISRNCGISKRTLYELFEDKNTLVISAIIYKNELQRELINQIEKDSSNNLELLLKIYLSIRDSIIGLCPAFFIDMERLYPEIESQYKTVRNDNILRFKDMLEGGVAEGVFRTDFDSQIVANLYFNDIQSMKKSSNIFQWNHSFIEVYDTFFDCFIRGVLSVKGLEIYNEFIKRNKR
ncbi:MAG: TetR/AcrR family transcriptional regulator [Muribaculaceae bacterium]|nr:TetR/AcrR family transcriptional regulator [Muribaculaceae bacterium]